ncbi:DUF2971 domain-containing protein [Celeribacter sp. PS-C1]|uniref:DUF2971 domain-containing protein n=1 Tax=Celeribacter sp. PS-C1 TaxID=2820813 RepID=UPI001C6660C7|nr:DUF2971 domain-containing protein [Celeribacter sp. PS-C1]MBW6417692.1 DUF2971 domain-containing protein [Celeribacter sp. PS-C1]
MRLCYYTPSKHLISTLQNKHLKVSRFNKCNDIFELGNFRIPYDTDLTKRQEARRPIRDWSNRMDAQYGLICFSDNHYSPLMWAHYADRNRGACLVFDYHPEKSRGKLVRVEYKASREEILPDETVGLPETNIFGLSDAELQRCFATKQSQWSYEKEHRLIVNLEEMKTERDNHFFDWGNSLKLKEVYVGSNPNICTKALETSVDGRVILKQKRAGFGEYQVVTQQDKKLWKAAKCSSKSCCLSKKSNDEGCA